MKKILIYRKTGNIVVQVSDKLHGMLCVYKVFWPPEATIKLGKKKTLTMKEFTPWPPPEQVPLLEVEAKKQERKTDLG